MKQRWIYLKNQQCSAELSLSSILCIEDPLPHSLAAGSVARSLRLRAQRESARAQRRRERDSAQAPEDRGGSFLGCAMDVTIYNTDLRYRISVSSSKFTQIYKCFGIFLTDKGS
jgi:hypothetical protein